MTKAFSYPYMHWVGADTPGISAEELEAYQAHQGGRHLGEVLEINPGWKRATRYELLDQDPRGDLGPRWLTVYEIADEASAKIYAAKNDQPGGNRPTFTPGPKLSNGSNRRWRLMWHQVAEQGASSEPPYSIFMVGMNVPPDTTPEGLAEFNDFYTNTHVGEVMAMGGYDRGVRFELWRELAYPEGGSPRFCAIYTADKAATEAMLARRAAAPGPSPLSSGPPTWEAHDTLWRLVYRRLESAEV